MPKKPNPPGNPRIITVEDRTKADPDRGWRIATLGKTNRLVDILANPPPPDAAHAIAAAVSGAMKLPCTFRMKPNHTVDTFTEGSYEL